MMNNSTRPCRGAAIAFLITTALSLGVAAQPYLSPVSVVAARDGAVLYVAEHTANQVAVVDLAARSIAETIALSGAPTGLALGPEGSTLFVTTDGPDGQLLLVGLADDTMRTSIPCGHTPMAPVVTADGSRVYVCCRFDDAVAVVDVAAGTVAATIAVTREPVAAALSADGKKLFVANHLPQGPSDGAHTAAEVSVIDTASGKVIGRIGLPNGSTGVRGIAMASDGRFVYVTHVLARYQLPTTQLERGWMNTNALSIIDTTAAAFVNTVLLDSVELGAANPWGVACSQDGMALCVAHAGTHEVSVIDRAALHAKLDRVAAGQAVNEVSRCADDVPNDLSFLADIRRRVRLNGNGPRALAVVGSRAYVAQYFSDNVDEVDLVDETAAVASLPLGNEQPLTPERTGEMFFNDAQLCFQQWQSCASCHPDGRADGLNWDLLNDGMGNPKNTKSLLLSHATPPVMISGVRDKAETAVRAGIKYIQFAVRPPEDAEAIDAFLKAARPVPSPRLDRGGLNEIAQRGAAIFERAGCATCHSGEYYTNLASYDVGTGLGNQADWKFDTPMLVEMWRTAPYLHDGRAATIEEVLTKCNPEDRHGSTSDLTPEEIQDLAAYVESL